MNYWMKIFGIIDFAAVPISCIFRALWHLILFTERIAKHTKV